MLVHSILAGRGTATTLRVSAKASVDFLGWFCFGLSHFKEGEEEDDKVIHIHYRKLANHRAYYQENIT